MPDGNNIHRNVIFRDGGDKASQIIPFSQYDSFDPEDLWNWMEAYEKKTFFSTPRLEPRGEL